MVDFLLNNATTAAQQWHGAHGEEYFQSVKHSLTERLCHISFDRVNLPIIILYSIYNIFTLLTLLSFF